jgi:hypothetical protein
MDLDCARICVISTHPPTLTGSSAFLGYSITWLFTANLIYMSRGVYSRYTRYNVGPQPPAGNASRYIAVTPPLQPRCNRYKCLRALLPVPVRKHPGTAAHSPLPQAEISNLQI